MKKKKTYTLEEKIIKDLERTSKKRNINKSRIIELALTSYIDPNLEGLSLEEIKEILFELYDNIERLTKLRDECYEKLQE